MMSDLGCIPALWADDGDWVLVGDSMAAGDNLRQYLTCANSVVFITNKELAELRLSGIKNMEISPWGWDTAVKRKLLSINENLEGILPTNDYLRTIREMSNRLWSSEHLLTRITTVISDRLVGNSVYISHIEDLKQQVSKPGRYILKAPWSSSGRGLRRFDQCYGGTWSSLDLHQRKWAENIIKSQGGVMVEPYYNKVIDFGMEFECLSGTIEYLGLSIFHTSHGKYLSNLIASEDFKTSVLQKYISITLIEKVRNKIINVLTPLLYGKYEGAFGVDMMVVSDDKKMKLHPCVELNLRRTMGHVALSIAHNTPNERGVMRIEYDGRYRFTIAYDL